jgi:hypothetical protein
MKIFTKYKEHHPLHYYIVMQRAPRKIITLKNGMQIIFYKLQRDRHDSFAIKIISKKNYEHCKYLDTSYDLLEGKIYASYYIYPNLDERDLDSILNNIIKDFIAYENI